jgi:hypothetical protein
VANAVTLHAALMHDLSSLRTQEELTAAIERTGGALDGATFDAAPRRGAAMDFREMTGFAKSSWRWPHLLTPTEAPKKAECATAARRRCPAYAQSRRFRLLTAFDLIPAAGTA